MWVPATMAWHILRQYKLIQCQLITLKTLIITSLDMSYVGPVTTAWHILRL